MTEWQDSLSDDLRKQFSTAGISFPTDNVTLKKLREIAGRGLEWGKPNQFEESGIVSFLLGTLSAERDLAANAYFTARGIPLSRVGLHGDNDDPEEMIEALNESYQMLGISGSTEETKKLIEKFSEASRAMARDADINR
jgi:hypothetical protein